MHAAVRWRLVCYDVRDEKRYRRLHKVMKGYGEPVQYSIFRCRLDDRQTAELRWELAQILDAEDSLLIVDLCGGCAGRVVSQNHKAGWDAPPKRYAIVISGTDQAPAGVAEGGAGGAAKRLK